MMTETFTSKIGAARQVPGSRVWIEGARLARAGFTVGELYTLTENAGVLVGERPFLVLELATWTGTRKVSGKATKPIIDITGDLIRRVFAGRETVHVTYTVGTIIIS